MMPRLWGFGDNRAEHNVMLSGAGSLPHALITYSTRRFLPVTPAAAPPGWVAGNTPLTGDLMAVSKAWLASKETLRILQRPQVGPYDVTAEQGAALQLALAKSLSQARGG